MTYSSPSYAVRSTFLGVSNGDIASDVCVAGINFDLSTSNRPGTRFGPDAIRAASRMLYDGQNPFSWVNPLDSINLADVGNIPFPMGQLEKGLEAIAAAAGKFKHLIALGGDHTVTFSLLKALSAKTGPLGLVHFDAHTDAWPTCFGEPWGHGSVFRRVLEHKLVDPKRMVQIGIRAKVDRDVYDWLIEQGVTVIWANDVHLSDPIKIAAHIKEVVGDKPTYMSFDIDCLDPSQAPGTGSPEVGGLWTWQAVSIIRHLSGIPFKGMDVMEVSPPYDHAEITALAGATMAYEYLCLVAKAGTI
jgi:guanidinopropionase